MGDNLDKLNIINTGLTRHLETLTQLTEPARESIKTGAVVAGATLDTDSTIPTRSRVTQQC